MPLRAALLILLATASHAAASPDPSPTDPTDLTARAEAFLGPADRARDGVTDLDGDGRADCWSASWDGGSGFGGVHLEVRPGCGDGGDEHALNVDSLSSFGEFLAVATFAVEARAARPDRVAAFQAPIRERLYPGLAHRCAPARAGCPAPDPSFAWLLDEARTRGAPERAYAPIWSPGLPTLPPSQVMDLAAPDARRLVETLDAGEPAVAGPTPRGFVVYAAHNHGATIARTGGCARWDLYTTTHGVAVVDRARQVWSWAFIGTGGDKLRHPSIASVTCDDDTVTLEHRGEAGLERVVVDPIRGRWRKL